MKDKILLGLSVSLYLLGGAVLLAELIDFTPASADPVSTTSQPALYSNTANQNHWYK